jgi:hypothetical protein
MNEMTYLESLKVAWLLLWRGLLISFGIGVVAGVVLGLLAGFLGIEKSTIQVLGVLLGGAIGLFYAYPLVVRMALRKSFEGFRLQIVRDSN